MSRRVGRGADRSCPLVPDGRGRAAAHHCCGSDRAFAPSFRRRLRAGPGPFGGCRWGGSGPGGRHRCRGPRRERGTAARHLGSPDPVHRRTRSGEPNGASACSPRLRVSEVRARGVAKWGGDPGRSANSAALARWGREPHGARPRTRDRGPKTWGPGPRTRDRGLKAWGPGPDAQAPSAQPVTTAATIGSTTVITRALSTMAALDQPPATVESASTREVPMP